MDITAIHQIFLTCTSVTTDSRNCPQGSLFIALKGESFNGNAFAARALESGSAYAIVDEEAYAPAGDTRYIVVENSLKTLQQLANYHRRQMRTPIIGITGTNGKTTTKELMSTVLSQTHNVLYTLGNLNITSVFPSPCFACALNTTLPWWKWVPATRETSRSW